MVNTWLLRHTIYNMWKFKQNFDKSFDLRIREVNTSAMSDNNNKKKFKIILDHYFDLREFDFSLNILGFASEI